MFADGASPSDEQYARFFAKVQDTPECKFYSKKTHSNYRSRLRREATAGRRVSQSVQTTRDNAEAAGWGNNAHTAQQWEGVDHHLPPSTPTSDASTSTRSDCAPLLEEVTTVGLAHTVAMRAPAVFAQIRAARDPTVTQFEQWAVASGLPAVELFKLCLAFRSGYVGLHSGVSNSIHRTRRRVFSSSSSNRLGHL